MKRLALCFLSLSIACITAATSCGPLKAPSAASADLNAGGGTVALPWHPGHVWEQQGNAWKLTPLTALLGASAGMTLAAAHDKTVWAHYAEHPTSIDPCAFRPDDSQVAQWKAFDSAKHTQGWAILRCKNLKKIGLSHAFSRARFVFFCITIMLARGTSFNLGDQEERWVFRGGEVVARDGDIVSATPPNGMSWEECAKI